MNKLTISGYGKMGKEIEKLAHFYNFETVAIIDKEIDWETNKTKIQESQVIIDFSTPNSALSNIQKAFQLNIPIIVGTTGWYNRFDEIKNLCETQNKSMVYGSNYSIGVNLFFELNKKLAKLMNSRNEYETEITEIHHIQKLDSPSGTGISLANQIIKHNHQFESWINEPTTDSKYLPIISIRENEVTGTHIVKYKSSVDEISIQHQAFNRQGFAHGALYAAKFIINNQGFYNFSDILFNKD